MGVSPNRFCPQCGTQLASNAQLCINCGSRVSEPSSLALSQYGGSPASVPYREESSYPSGSSGQSYAAPPPLVGVPSAAPAPAHQQAVGARIRPAGVTFLAVLVGLQAADGILSFFLALGTTEIAALALIGILTVATIILVWGLWTLRRWAFVTAIVLEIVYLLFSCNLTFPANLETIIERVILEIVIPLTVLICLFAVRDVRAAFRGNPQQQGQQNVLLHPQYPQQMPPPQPQWQQLIPPQQQWYAQHQQFGQPQQFPPYAQQQPQWGQQLPPPPGQPFYRQPPYGVSPSPGFGQSQRPKERLPRWLWITLAVLGGIVAFSCIVVALIDLRVLLAPVIGASMLRVLYPCTLLIVVTIGLIIWLHIRNQYILQYGDLVEGRITEHGKERDEQTLLGYLTDFGGLVYTYYLTYTYEYRGKTYSANQKVRKKTYREIPDGTRIRVRCLPKHPQSARIDERWSRRIIIIP